MYLYDYAEWSNTVPFMPRPHVHRRWEYGMALEFIKNLGGVKTILDVGGAGSLFAPIAMQLGYHVTVVDPDPSVGMLAGQLRACGLPEAAGTFICKDFMQWPQRTLIDTFDVVVSISTIEHVPEDVAFVKKLQEHAERGLFLTTDFSMDGGQYSPGHLRTYTPKTLKNKILGALDDSWKMAGEPEWGDNGPYVLGYNFASAAVTNEKA